MPDAPNPKMDRLLRDYASQTRKRGDVSLHPATRQMLHREAARASGTPLRSTLIERLRAFLPQIAFGGGLALIAVVAVLSLRAPSKQPVQTAADAVSSKESEALSQPAPPVEPVERPRVEESMPLLSDVAARAEVPAPAQALAAGASARVQLRSAPETELKQKAALAKAARTEALARANDLTNLGAAMRLRFVETDRTRRDVRPTILSTFQMEQNGDALRLFDADGSVYSGQLFDSPTEQPVTLDTLTSRTVPLQNTHQMFFSVQGTNRTLAKPVVVQGTYYERTNGVPSPEKTFSFATNDAKAGVAPTFRRAIVGRAVVGQTNQVPVSAVSIEP